MKLTRYNGNFVKCLNDIGLAGQEIATARQGMIDRIKAGFDSDYKSKGCWYPEGTARIEEVNYWCLPEFAPTTNYPQETLEANERNNYLSLNSLVHKKSKKLFTELILEIAEADKRKYPQNRRVLIPERQETFSHPSEHLDEVDIALFSARDKNLAKDYGEFLKYKCKIDSVTFYQLGNQDNVGAGFWLGRLGLGGDSGFGGYDRDFGSDVGSLFGVARHGVPSKKEGSAKPTQKILEEKPYSEKDVQRYLKILDAVVKGDVKISELESKVKPVYDFLEKLKR